MPVTLQWCRTKEAIVGVLRSLLNNRVDGRRAVSLNPVSTQLRVWASPEEISLITVLPGQKRRMGSTYGLIPPSATTLGAQRRTSANC
jgi:hypothetical protein